MTEAVIQHVSDTAFLVAYFRAFESARPDALFHDPLAARLPGEKGRQLAEWFATAAITAWNVAVRTVVIDDFVRGAVARRAARTRRLVHRLRVTRAGSGFVRVISCGMGTMISLRSMTPEDWPAVRTIYQEGIATGNATFELAPPDWEAWDRVHVRACRIVATENEGVVGWAALSPVSSRKVYSGVADLSIYVAAALRGRSIGRLLLEALINESEQNGFWTLQAGIFPENAGSLALHQRCGFRIVGTRERVGEMNGRWRDVVLLERRRP